MFIDYLAGEMSLVPHTVPGVPRSWYLVDQEAQTITLQKGLGIVPWLYHFPAEWP